MFQKSSRGKTPTFVAETSSTKTLSCMSAWRACHHLVAWTPYHGGLRPLVDWLPSPTRSETFRPPSNLGICRKFTLPAWSYGATSPGVRRRMSLPAACVSVINLLITGKLLRDRFVGRIGPREAAIICGRQRPPNQKNRARRCYRPSPEEVALCQPVLH